MSRHRNYTHHSDLDARPATVNLHKLACVTITPRLVQQPASAVRHVRGCRLAISHAFRETPVPATACEHSRWPSFETLSRSRLPVGRESYLVDTGAEISLLPLTDYDRKFRTRGSPLRAANNTDIASFGERTKSLKLGTNTLCWRFNVADVSQPILGADFLCHHGLLVNVRRRRLINAETF